MALRFVPDQRTILLCNFSLGGFVAPEMVKRRPSIAFSPRLHSRRNLCTVVPLSSKQPERPLPYVVELHFDDPLSEHFSETVMWAKCDMVATVSLERLDLFRAGRAKDGKRLYSKRKLCLTDFRRVQIGVRSALGLAIDN